MQGVFKKHFRSLYKDSQIMARSEIRRADNAKKNENIPAEEFMAFLEKETHQYVGDWEYTINKRTRNAINNAIKDGRPISDVVGILDDEGKALSDVSLERYSRTKSTEVFNRGRMEYFDSTGVVAAYQFAAILDDVTSEICGSLHGLTFPVGEAPVPPLHFNCRSVLVPITKYEDWSADGVTNSGKNVDKFLEENVTDKGFAVYTHEEKVRKPQITDAGVGVYTSYPDSRTEKTTYKWLDKAFQETVCEYVDDTKTKIKSLVHKRLD
jgi:SPP1 gp7 family putative phage head morphogenesis protein